MKFGCSIPFHFPGRFPSRSFLSDLSIPVLAWILSVLLVGEPVVAQPPLFFDAPLPSEGGLGVVVDLDGDGFVDSAVRQFQTVVIRYGDGTGRFLEPNFDWVESDLVTAIGSGDFDGDGDRDLVAVLSRQSLLASEIVIRLNLGQRTFSESWRGEFQDSLAGDPALVVGNILGDAQSDLALAIGMPRRLVLFEGIGQGQLRFASEFSLNHRFQHILAADLSGNGWSDLVLSRDVTSFQTLLSDGGGGFTSVVRFSPVKVRETDAGDVDADGDLDLLAGSEILVNRGDGTFESQRIVIQPGTGSRLADVNDDGNLDVVGRGGIFLQMSGLQFESSEDGVSWETGEPNVVDADRDGRVDLIAPYKTHLGRGDGMFLMAQPLTTQSALCFFPPFVTLVVEDWDQDGDTDFSILCEGHPMFGTTLNTFLQNNIGEFIFSRTSHVEGYYGSPFGLADFDQDGLLDFHGASFSRMRIHRGGCDSNKENCILANEDSEGFVGICDSTAGDFNGDGHLDILARDEVGGIQIFRGDGSGGVAPGERIDRIPLDPECLRPVLVGDVDSDGFSDYVDLGPDEFSVWFGDPTGEFARSMEFPTVGSLRRSLLSDLDGDGHLDLVKGSAYDELVVHRGGGDGTFGAPVVIPVEGFEFMDPIAAADLDNDGDLELLTEERVLLHEGRGSMTFTLTPWPSDEEVRVADFDGDGYLDLAGLELGIVYNLTGTLLEARTGNVNASLGPPVPVLFVNDESGVASTYVHHVAQSDPFTLFLDSPPSRPRSGYALYLVPGLSSTVMPHSLPFGLGSMVVPTPITGDSPTGIRIASTLGRRGILGESNWPTPFDLAPHLLLDLSGGFPRAISFAVQGVMIDSAAPNGIAGVTNAAIVVVE